jgi:3-methyl-2-oxobutanoate hydroxymethyltransferase
MAGLRAGKLPRFVKQYAQLADALATAARTYADEVRTGIFPGPEHGF